MIMRNSLTGWEVLKLKKDVKWPKEGESPDSQGESIVGCWQCQVKG